MATVGSILRRNFPIFQIFGANTNVGKTIFSTILLRAAKRLYDDRNIWYLKPVSTGSLDDADQNHITRHAPGILSQNLYQFDLPMSPHIAARTSPSAGGNTSRSEATSDSVLLERISKQIKDNANQGAGVMFVETAGGINSPAPSGTLQAELYRSLRLPTILVADWQLGGISTSISAFESLHLRGYDVAGVTVLQDTYYKNFEYFQAYFRDRQIPILSLPQPPAKSESEDESIMKSYYSSVDSESSSSETSKFVNHLIDQHGTKISELEKMPATAYNTIWYPFTQHQNLQPQNLTVIDSAYGDYFQRVSSGISNDSNQSTTTSSDQDLLKPAMDGSGSWWTQGLGHGSYDLTMAAAHAAGRYGHVMFAEAINEPALSLATKLVDTVGNPRLKRVFYSDNGSTAMEVGLKMALTATCARYGWDLAHKEIEILGLQGSYHGDTIGAMDMSEPSVFNDRIHWYKGRGFWFDPPSVIMREGKWIVRKPAVLQKELGSDTEFASLQQVFNQSRDLTNEAAAYDAHIRSVIQRLTEEEKRVFGAVVMEPVVLGAGGMVLVDPLFQRTLVKVVRDSGQMISGHSGSAAAASDNLTWTGLPIVADEIFTGLYRLGHPSSSSLLNIDPDIAAYAKLLTGGLVPLSCTLASESVFNAFLADGKADCLLHGHSYTAHPIGCAVACASLDTFKRLDTEGAWQSFKADWLPSFAGNASTASQIAESTVSALGIKTKPPSSKAEIQPELWSVWSTGFVSHISNLTNVVEGVWALGSVLAITLRDQEGSGYTSNAAKAFQKKLTEDQGVSWSFHCRVLGNVLYLMTSQVTKVEHVRLWEERVIRTLEQ